ncbi:sulfite exporter TauE/SafE family protein [Spongiibacter sp. KMU-158]|uniref:Probable membrane transporter protein n=1 Tax=Spongiibacter pelagi TaxID=2760804 RepID=A0A927C1H0_9GAMM|nr:sulfite exporter TauE/SafE family protein [Spongiibacter pelagi]MBD2858292.1 sulfite exporter TauE/SafE family protein [Spongiibacter pelagi]
MISDPFFYLCAIPAVLIFGMAKGGFGGGVSVISVPLISLAVSPVQAASILLPILIVMDGVALWSFRGRWDSANLRIIIPGAILGIFLGSLSFHFFSEHMIRILIGSIAVIFCLDYWFRPVLAAAGPSVLRGGFWGTIAGFTSFGIHAGGPPISIYLLPQRMEKTRLMGTMAVFFAVVNLIKLLPYGLQGNLATQNLFTALVLMPLAPIGVRLGYFLLHKVDEKQIYRICYFFLFIVGLKLLGDGFGLW